MFWAVPLLTAHCSGDSGTGEVLALEAAVWSSWAGVEGLWVQFGSWGLKEWFSPLVYSLLPKPSAQPSLERMARYCQALWRRAGAQSMRHDPCTVSTHVMSSAEHEVGLWEGRVAGAVQSSFHGLKCITQSWEWKLGLQSSPACYDNSSHHSLNCVISVFLVDEPYLGSPAVGVGVLVSW